MRIDYPPGVTSQAYVATGDPFRKSTRQCSLWVALNLPTFDGHLVKGILTLMEVFHEPQGIQEV